MTAVDFRFTPSYSGNGRNYQPHSRKIGTKTEVGRLETFQDWTLSRFLSPLVLVRCGFYSTKKGGEVQCDDCLVKISEWENKHHPFIEHYKLNKRCKYVKVIGKLISYLSLLKSSEYFGESVDFTTMVSSFEGHENLFRQPVTDMVGAGLYYNGHDDYVKCAFCHIVLKQWQPCDIPAVEHILWSPSCPHAMRLSRDIACALTNTSMSLEEMIQDAWEHPTNTTVKYDTKKMDNFIENSKNANPKELFKKTEFSGASESAVKIDATLCKDEEEKLQEMNHQIDAVSFMDLDRDIVLKFALDHLKTTGNNFDSAEELYVAITKTGENDKCPKKIEEYEKEEKYTHEATEKRMGHQKIALQPPQLENPNDIKFMNSAMDERLHCKICLENPLEVTFQPCGHLMSCRKCSKLVDTCPVCRTTIGHSITTYIP